MEGYFCGSSQFLADSVRTNRNRLYCSLFRAYACAQTYVCDRGYSRTGVHTDTGGRKYSRAVDEADLLAPALFEVVPGQRPGRRRNLSTNMLPSKAVRWVGSTSSIAANHEKSSLAQGRRRGVFVATALIPSPSLTISTICHSPTDASTGTQRVAARNRPTTTAATASAAAGGMPGKSLTRRCAATAPRK